MAKMGSTSREMLCLRWEEFGSHFSTSFRDLRRQSCLYDVSLVASDSDELVQAHKIILSTCSPFFRNVLARQARASPLSGLAHPVIYLRGISAKDLGNILDFMYEGEVNVAQEELDAFLAVAEDLKIRGLTEGEEQEQETKTEFSRGKRSAPQPPADVAPKKRPSMKPLTQQQQQPPNVEDVVKSEPSLVPVHQPDTSSDAIEVDLAAHQEGASARDDSMGYDDGGSGVEGGYGAEGQDYGRDFGGQDDNSGELSFEREDLATSTGAAGMTDATDSEKGTV